MPNIDPAINTIETGKPARILVAEDNEVNQKLIGRMFEKLGITIDIATNGRIAVDMIRAQPYDIVFMDVMMPEMDGMEATKAILEHYAEKKRPFIIAMTAHTLPGDREKTLDGGMDDYISKPFRLDDIKKKLATWGQSK